MNKNKPDNRLEKVLKLMSKITTKCNENCATCSFSYAGRECLRTKFKNLIYQGVKEKEAADKKEESVSKDAPMTREQFVKMIEDKKSAREKEFEKYLNSCIDSSKNAEDYICTNIDGADDTADYNVTTLYLPETDFSPTLDEKTRAFEAMKDNIKKSLESKYPYLNFEVESGGIDYERSCYTIRTKVCMVVRFSYSLKETE